MIKNLIIKFTKMEAITVGIDRHVAIMAKNVLTKASASTTEIAVIRLEALLNNIEETLDTLKITQCKRIEEIKEDIKTLLQTYYK